MPALQGVCLFPTAIGHCGIAWGEAAVLGVQLPEEDDARTLKRLQHGGRGAQERPPPAWVRAVITRIQRSLSGDRDDLADVPLDMNGLPEFNQRVYAVARAIPPGRTLTYGDIARQLGEPGASRAVGQALGRNPFAPVVPCHRVLSAGNGAGGFSARGGVATKLRLLEIEKAQFGAQKGLFD